MPTETQPSAAPSSRAILAFTLLWSALAVAHNVAGLSFGAVEEQWPDTTPEPLVDLELQLRHISILLHREKIMSAT